MHVQFAKTHIVHLSSHNEKMVFVNSGIYLFTLCEIRQLDAICAFRMICRNSAAGYCTHETVAQTAVYKEARLYSAGFVASEQPLVKSPCNVM